MKISKKLIIITIAVLVRIIGGGVAYATNTPTVRADRQLNLGNKYLQEGKYQEAILAFQKVIEIEPKNIPARLGLGKVYVATKEFAKAEVVLKEVIGIDQKNIPARVDLFKVYLKEGKLDAANAILQEINQINPNEDVNQLKADLESAKAKSTSETGNNNFSTSKPVAVANNSTSTATQSLQPLVTGESDIDEQTASKILSDFTKSNNKHLKLTMTSANSKEAESSEVWIRGNEFRMDEIVNKEMIGRILGTKNTYIHYDFLGKEKVSVIGSAMITSDYNFSDANIKYIGKDENSKGLLFYVIQNEKHNNAVVNGDPALDSIYTKTVKYCVSKRGIEYIEENVIYEKTPRPTKSFSTKSNFDIIELDKLIEDSTFNPPF